MSFYIEKNKDKSCHDFEDKNVSKIHSISQFTRKKYLNESSDELIVNIYNCQFRDLKIFLKKVNQIRFEKKTFICFLIETNIVF